mmetsp:Transcript_40721/g.122652  ORF Transcript_40721/g.122652 Transcript_40721/m.122652 type:complete len:225 (+) Transcript_40721:347-1021(+)
MAASLLLFISTDVLLYCQFFPSSSSLATRTPHPLTRLVYETFDFKHSTQSARQSCARLAHSFSMSTGAAARKYTLPLVIVTTALRISRAMLGWYRALVRASPTRAPLPPAPAGTARSIVSATMVAAVLIFPCIPTLTESLAPLCAIHSLRADTAISLARIMEEGMATHAPYRPLSRISAVDTMSLSATGSRKAPNALVMSHRRARYPSRKSVRDAAANKVDVQT